MEYFSHEKQREEQKEKIIVKKKSYILFLHFAT